jgi:NAD(P)-dependent dehydrogenase (short-subunit alcohol dehydrogenase family)
MELRGKTAVVTGGANGIGEGIVLALAEAGASSVVADLEVERAEEVAARARRHGVDAVAAAVDVADFASVDALAAAAYERFGAVHVLCNNAGVGAMSPLDALAPGDWEWVLSVNLGGVFNGVRAFVPRMRAQGGGAHIVNTASEHGLGVPFAGMGVYTASKHAVVGLSDVMRHDYAAEGIGVSVLCPGWVNTTIWNCARNRPGRFGGPVETPAEVGRLWEERGMDPLEVGRATVAAVARGDFWILTHPEVRGVAETRCREVAAAFDALDERVAKGKG